MKILSSLFIVSIALSAHAQINQKTASLRKQYPLLHSFELKEVPTTIPERNFITHDNQPVAAHMLSTEHFPKPSTHSIQKAFNYYNGLKKQPDFSSVLMMGYSLMTNKNLVFPQPQESIRFFPGNSHN